MSIEPLWQVGINAHLLSRQAGYRSTGIHGYISNLLRHLPAAEGASDLRFTVFLGEGQLESDRSLTVMRSTWPTGRPAIRILWEQLALPILYLRGKLAGLEPRLHLLHSMAFVTPLAFPWPTVITVYDLSFIHFPATFPTGQRAYLRLFARLSCRRARRVIAISESTRRDLVKQWGLSADRISVACPGVGEQFQPLPADKVAAFRARRGLPERFILHLGTLQPRKNLPRLIQAYGRLRGNGTSAKLVLAGDKGWLYGEIAAEIQKLNLQGDVIMPGYVEEAELPYWYNAAAVLAYPSLYEGFGLPVVEAMACQTPVVTSNVSSMPEAVGQAGEPAALLVDPQDTGALADALHLALTDGSLREELRDRGRLQAANFTWQRTATATVNAYRQALALSGGR